MQQSTHHQHLDDKKVPFSRLTQAWTNENILNTKFEEKLHLAKKSLRLPLVLSKEEINKMIEATNNLKHKLVIMFLYYAGLRLDEVRNLIWEDIDFDREIIHLKTAKGDKERIVFLYKKLINMLKMYGTKEEGLIFVSQWENTTSGQSNRLSNMLPRKQASGKELLPIL
ncbi:MAG: tyrosine-type recombinase/integrase [Candidatus Aenigmatarchaeota archaeon]